MSNSNEEFVDKVVLITGATSGIGAQTAIHFSMLGASLALTARNLPLFKKVAEQCTQPGKPKPLLIQADLVEEEDVKKIVDETIAHYSRLDVLVNNAAEFKFGTIHTSTLEDLDLLYKSSLRSLFQLTQLAVPHLITTKGNIANVSGSSSQVVISEITILCMIKAAVDQFTRCLSTDLGKHKVRVNSVNPGLTSTDLFSKAGMSETQIEELFETTRKMCPLGRTGRPTDIAEAIAFLASEKAGFITGVNLFVDGGKRNVSFKTNTK